MKKFYIILLIFCKISYSFDMSEALRLLGNPETTDSLSVLLKSFPMSGFAPHELSKYNKIAYGKIEALTPLAIALALALDSQISQAMKERKSEQLIFANDVVNSKEESYRVKNYLSAMKYLLRSKKDLYVLYQDSFFHAFIIYSINIFNKQTLRNNKYIMFLDSTGAGPQLLYYIRIFVDKAKELSLYRNTDLFLYATRQARQNDLDSCGVYALEDLRIILASKDLKERLLPFKGARALNWEVSPVGLSDLNLVKLPLRFHLLNQYTQEFISYSDGKLVMSPAIGEEKFFFGNKKISLIEFFLNGCQILSESETLDSIKKGTNLVFIPNKGNYRQFNMRAYRIKDRILRDLEKYIKSVSLKMLEFAISKHCLIS